MVVEIGLCGDKGFATGVVLFDFGHSAVIVIRIICFRTVNGDAQLEGIASLQVNVLRHASSVWIQLDRVTSSSVRGGNSVLPVSFDREAENMLLIPNVELSI